IREDAAPRCSGRHEFAKLFYYVGWQCPVRDHPALAAHIDARPVERLLEARAIVDQERGHLQYRAEDLATPGGAERGARTIGSVTDYGAIVAQAALSGSE